MEIPSSTAASSSIYQANGANNSQQRRQSLEALTQALQSGNLDGAKQAYAALVQNTPGAGTNPNSPLAKIGQALQSGDLAGAQTAFAAIQSARHGHHHHHGNSQPVSLSAESTPSTHNTGTVGSTLSVSA